MDSNTIQQRFFHEIKTHLAPHLSLVDEVADVLNISTDSSYRRIRGEKAIDLEDLRRLSIRYKISIDKFLVMESNSFIFSDRSVIPNSGINFDFYLQALVDDLLYMNSFKTKVLYYLNKDIPIFHHFRFPELAAFKCFFWMKSILHNEAFSKENFDLEKYKHLFAEKAQQINSLYMQIPSVEIWNIDSINSTLRQLDYYRNIKAFARKEDILSIYNCLEEITDQIEQYAENGEKRLHDKPLSKGSPYQVFINEFILGDNTILLEMDDSRVVYINHGIINYMMTKDEIFCSFTKDCIENIIKKSIPISNSNERDRNRFFGRIREKIHNRKQSL